jgi:microcystin-dependent protein
MNNISDLQATVLNLNYETVPSILEYITNLNFHVGEYKWSSRSEDFGLWFKCDGRSLSKTEYPKLFDAIGTSFGSDDSDTFNLPDLRGRVMGCIGTGDGLSARSKGDVVGAERHTLASNEMPAHTHTGTTAANGSHTHTASNAGSHTHTITDPGHTHTQTTINDDFNSSGTSPPGFTQDSAGAMTWNNINSATTGITINSAGDHTHTLSSNGDHTHTFTTNSTGSGQSHNNMQPTAFVGHVFIFVGYKNDGHIWSSINTLIK